MVDRPAIGVEIMIGDQIFLPAIGSERGIGEIFPIDVHAPRGIFETADGNIFLVSDSPGSRAAIALKHHSHKPFLLIELDHNPIDTGVWLGVGKFVLVEELEENAGDELGQLRIEDEIAQIWSVWNSGGWCRRTIAHGWCDYLFVRFGIWALVVGERIVFQHDEGGTYFPEQLAAKVRELM